MYLSLALVTTGTCMPWILITPPEASVEVDKLEEEDEEGAVAEADESEAGPVGVGVVAPS